MRYFLPLDRNVEVYIDDYAPGHSGPAPDHFLRTLGAQRIRVPRNGTARAQAADRPQCNGLMKRLICKAMRALNMREKLDRHFRIGVSGETLSYRTKVLISQVLADVRHAMNTTEKYQRGIRRAFDETTMPDTKPHSGLQEMLDTPAPDPPTNEEAEERPVVCANGCGETWTKESLESYRKHDKSCWFKRSLVLAPVLDNKEQQSCKTNFTL